MSTDRKMWSSLQSIISCRSASTISDFYDLFSDSDDLATQSFGHFSVGGSRRSILLFNRLFLLRTDELIQCCCNWMGRTGWFGNIEHDDVIMSPIFHWNQEVNLMGRTGEIESLFHKTCHIAWDTTINILHRSLSITFCVFFDIAISLHDQQVLDKT